MLFIIRNKKILLLLVVLFLFSYCNKDKDNDQVPYYYVSFKVYTNQAQYSELNSPGNSMILTSNVVGENQTPHGIIVYRLSGTEFKAYGRTCTNIPSNSCAVNIDSTGVYAVCPCCGSKFLLLDGYPTSGKAEMPLVEYNTTFSNDILYVSSF